MANNINLAGLLSCFLNNVRNTKQFRAISKYILMNPVKAGLKSGYRVSSNEKIKKYKDTGKMPVLH